MLEKIEDLWDILCSLIHDIIVFFAPIWLGLTTLTSASMMSLSTTDESIVVMLSAYSVWFGMTQTIRSPSAIMKIFKRED